jgi:hypothetical protein
MLSIGIPRDSRTGSIRFVYESRIDPVTYIIVPYRNLA